MIAIHQEAWKPGGESPMQWRACLRDYGYPPLGETGVDRVTMADVVAVLPPSARGSTRRRNGSAAAPGVSVMSPADRVARISAALRARSAIINDRACPEGMTSKRSRHSAGFGKRLEYWIVGRMLKEGMDVYLPLVDDHAVDAIVKRPDGTAAQIQVKARSREVIEGDAALFAAIPHPEEREDYWSVFYSERMDALWIMTSTEFCKESVQNKTGKNKGLRGIWFNGMRKTGTSGLRQEYTKP